MHIKQKPNNTMTFHVCRARFCSKQATHTQIKKTVHKKIRSENVMLHTSIIQIELVCGCLLLLVF